METQLATLMNLMDHTVCRRSQFMNEVSLYLRTRHPRTLASGRRKFFQHLACQINGGLIHPQRYRMAANFQSSAEEHGMLEERNSRKISRCLESCQTSKTGPPPRPPYKPRLVWGAARCTAFVPTHFRGLSSPSYPLCRRAFFLTCFSSHLIQFR